MGNSPSPSLASNPGLRQFELLEILAAQGRALNLAEAVAASGWPKPSVHRMLAQLEAGGLLAREPDGRRYLEVHQPLSRSAAEFNSSLPAPLPMTQAATRFIAHADSDSQLVKQALEQRSGMPIAINR